MLASAAISWPGSRDVHRAKVVNVVHGRARLWHLNGASYLWNFFPGSARLLPKVNDSVGRSVGRPQRKCRHDQRTCPGARRSWRAGADNGGRNASPIVGQIQMTAADRTNPAEQTNGAERTNPSGPNERRGTDGVAERTDRGAAVSKRTPRAARFKRTQPRAPKRTRRCSIQGEPPSESPGDPGSRNPNEPSGVGIQTNPAGWQSERRALRGARLPPPGGD